MSESTPANSPAGDTATLETRHRGLLMIAVMGVSIIQFLDVTIATVALPHMQSSLGGTFDTIPWVLTSYIIAGVMFTPAVGWVSDRFGSRRVFLFAVAGFIAASMLCGVATSLPEMILFRSLQGVCTAFIGPMAQTIVFDINPPSKQANAVSVWGMVSMLAPISGPIVGGLICDNLSWRWVFFINLPIGIPALLILFWLLPSRQIASRKLDKFGFLALAVGLVALQLMLDRGQHKDWFDSIEIVVELIIIISAFWIFFIHTATTKNALFPAPLFKNTLFLTSLLLMFVLGLANVGVVSVLPMMYDSIWNYGPLDSGILLVPRGVGLLITMSIASQLMNRVDIRYLVSTGLVIVAVAMWMMSRWTIEMGQAPILISGFIQGMGLGLTVMPMNLAAFSTVQAAFRPDASSLFSLMRNIGGSFGISCIVTMISRNSQIGHAEIAANVTANSVPTIDPLPFAQRFGDAGTAMFRMIDLEVTRQALMTAYLDVFYLMAILMIVLGIAFLLVKPIRIGGNQT